MTGSFTYEKVNMHPGSILCRFHRPCNKRAVCVRASFTARCIWGASDKDGPPSFWRGRKVAP